MPSPHVTAFIWGPDHWRVSLAAERRLKLRKIRQRAYHPIFSDRVRVGLHHDSLFFDADGVSAPLSPGDEKLLLGRKAIDIRRARFAHERFLISQKCNLRATQVANARAEHHFAIVVDAGFYEVIIELIRHTRAALLELRQIDWCPPVSQVSQVVELRALE